MIRLTHDTITPEDMEALADWLRTNPRLTRGDKVREFEEQFAAYNERAHCIMVNSGSSANLLATYAMVLSGTWDEYTLVNVPAVCWSTDVAPLIQFRVPFTVHDVDPETLSIDCKGLKNAVVIAALGMVPHNLRQLDADCILDCCEAMGTKINNTPIGHCGYMSTHSFFFSHQMSTIEGGAICTDDEELHRLLLSLRSHGWTRDWPNASNEFDNLFKFIHPGFNVRPTEINAFLGLRGLKSIDYEVDIRHELFTRYADNLGQHRSQVDNNTISAFGFPYICKHRDVVLKRLDAAGVEYRPIISGNIMRHPMMRGHRRRPLPIADMVHDYGLYLPLHPNMEESDVDMVCELVTP